MPQMEMRILELLCSRLCHDLVGPIGAVNNGIELLEESDPAMASEVLPLVTTSARQAWRRLDFFRVAFGFAGGRTSWPAADLRRYASGWLEDGKARLDWPEGPPGEAGELDGSAAKLLLNMILLGAEALPRGGRVSVALQAAGPVSRIGVTAAGPVAALHERVAAVLEGPSGAEDVEARTVQAYFTRRLADAMGASLRLDRGEGRLTLLADAPC